MSAASARGLFRATGKAAKPVAVREGFDLGGAFVVKDHLPRERDDFYPTPPEPVRAFLAAELPRLRDFGAVWEPAAGDGAMVRELRDAGLSVFTSDLVDRGGAATIRSFYDFDRQPVPGAVIVTNPPFAECSWSGARGRWITHALDVLRAPYMALLLPVTWPSAAGLARLWAVHTPAREYRMRFRIDFTGQGAPPSGFSWFVWDGRTREGETRLMMLDRADSRQGDLLGGGA